jgi:hypothetical protein
LIEIQSRNPNNDDFEKMSYMSRGSVRSKASTNQVQPKFAGNLIPSLLTYNAGLNETPIHKRPFVYIDVNLGKEKGKQKLVIY